MALDMLPSFRWRWERKDQKGGHPLIAKLAEEVLKVQLHQVSPTTPPLLIGEADWESEGILSPKGIGQHPSTPTMGPAQYPLSPFTKSPPIQGIKGSPGKPGMASLNPPRDEKLAEVPPGLFYPFYPETQTPNSATAALLNGPSSISPFGFQSSQDSFMLEEKDAPVAPSSGAGMHTWPTNGVRLHSSICFDDVLTSD